MHFLIDQLDTKMFEVVYYGDDIILNHPIEEWPIVDVLLAFYSDGFPLEKIAEYSELRKPLIINDIFNQ